MLHGGAEGARTDIDADAAALVSRVKSASRPRGLFKGTLPEAAAWHGGQFGVRLTDTAPEEKVREHVKWIRDLEESEAE